jgi:hypothetical protein
MKIKKEIAILFFIITVLLFYIYSEKGEKTHYQLPDIETVNTEDVSKISISSKDSNIILIKGGDGWLIAPQNYPADETAVNNLVRIIAELKLTALVSESKNYSIYELDKNNSIEVESYAGDKVLRKISIGKPASSYRHNFVMLGDDYRVYHAEGNMKNEFNKTVSDLRDKLVMKFSDEIAEITMKKAGNEMTVIRTTPPASVDITDQDSKAGVEDATKWIASDGSPVKAEEIDEIISSLSNFQCDEYIEDRDKDDFISPLFTLTLKGINTYTMSLFEKQDDQYPAISSESEYPFFISEWKAKKIMKEFDSLKPGE